ncbi:thioredoxin domain-containing protein 11 [Achroia grisella]|uniref:thioredoxin domain-containing protein 11 n=1 Tax=Achroia grisella TaxID=688607 RepID=UPI0027D2964C|nr:thioredoxin domain-containing protein 11 [Achroia grisella]
MFPTANTEDIVQVTSFKTNSGGSSNERDPLSSTQVAKQQNRDITLNMLIKEMVFCVALALTTYGALHNTSTKVSKYPQAVRFFSTDSIVKDWYRGQLSNALSAINSVDVSFVMYYAPWDAESQYVRGEFEKAALILRDYVHFSAINCWNPGSECRLHHSKIPSWPILMAYTVNSRGVLYKGPRDAHSMVNFLQMIMKPLERVSTTEHLVHLLSICDAVAVGYTPLTDTSRYYNIWYYAAMKAREFDTVGEICFAVVTSEELAIDLGVEVMPNARMMLWNDTKEFLNNGDIQSWNESSLLHWVLENFSQPVARVIPMWKKAFSFERYVDGNPILILFTPLNPLYEQLPSYDLLREVAMEYYNCNNNESTQWTSELIKLQQVQRLLYQQKDFVKFCQQYKFKKSVSKHNLYYKKEIVSQNNKYPWSNVTQKSQKTGSVNILIKRGLPIPKLADGSYDESQVLSSLALLQECISTELPAEKSFYDNYEQCQSQNHDRNVNIEENSEEHLTNLETTMLPFEDDPLSPDNLVQENVKHFCKLMKFAYETNPPAAPTRIPTKEEKQNMTNVHGLACAKNFSLHMLAVDSVANHHFAEFLGIDISKRKDKTIAVILNSKHESQYVLSEEYSAKSIRDFIYNFTYKSLKRSLRTHVEDAAHTHYYGSEGKTTSKGTNNSSIEVIDLTTRSFKKLINTPGTVRLVMVCGGSCGAARARALAAAARRLRAASVPARAARLDALRHDLPWQYSGHVHPTVFVFPADMDKEAESRSYPSMERITSSGLVALALRSLAPPEQLRVRLHICQRAHANEEKKICLKYTREHVTTVIDRSLKYWRWNEHRELKDALLKRLQYLHQVSLDLSVLHTSDLNSDNKRYETLLSNLNLLSKTWKIDMSNVRDKKTRS